MGWPVKIPGWSLEDNIQQAKDAITFMRMGRGKRGEYRKYITKLKRIYPPSKRAYAEIWEDYNDSLPAVNAHLTRAQKLRRV